VAGLPPSVGTRELSCIGDAMKWDGGQLHMRRLPAEQGPGNAVLITLEYEHVTEVCAGFGARAVRAEAVAQEAIAQAKAYMESGAAAGEHLADQLMLPMAFAGGGRFTASTVSSHAETNAAVIARFLPVAIDFERGARRNTCVVKSTCQAR
jgi:RNA 3'-terminal phosphate cyclase (ATP)